MSEKKREADDKNGEAKSNRSEPKNGFVSRFLAVVERVGNALPNPAACSPSWPLWWCWFRG